MAENKPFDTKRFSVTLDKQTFRKLKSEAFYEDRSVDKMASIILKDYYKNKDIIK